MCMYHVRIMCASVMCASVVIECLEFALPVSIERHCIVHCPLKQVTRSCIVYFVPLDFNAQGIVNLNAYVTLLTCLRTMLLLPVFCARVFPHYCPQMSASCTLNLDAINIQAGSRKIVFFLCGKKRILNYSSIIKKIVCY